MSDDKAPLSDIRLSLGYIKPGEQYNKALFRGNVVIFICLVLLVAFLFTCYSKRDASNKLQDRDLMSFAILSGLVLALFALPINMYDGLNHYARGVYYVSRHPIYPFLMFLTVVLSINISPLFMS